jgi:hypothetical protein
MEDLATFEQVNEMKGLSSPVARSGVCIACCVEWLRAVIHNFKSFSQSPSETRMGIVNKKIPTIVANANAPSTSTLDPAYSKQRMDHLRNRKDTIISKQEEYSSSDNNAKGLAEAQKEVRGTTSLNSKRQFRTGVVVNSIGGRVADQDEEDWTLHTDEQALDAAAIKLKDPNLRSGQFAKVSNMTFSPTTPYHILLLTIDSPKDSKFYHAIATAAYAAGVGSMGLLVFDPNIGEVAIKHGDMAGMLSRTAKKYGDTCRVRTVRYLPIRAGAYYIDPF